ncbi:hypothetical protein SDC9_187596 [bioreactor metagenome]|uniref:Uncharacterized protein n=1 Tax=bioreactor metagenome TaxID=1076179 RepID=A0A645HM03_9ZZZZ
MELDRAAEVGCLGDRAAALRAGKGQRVLRELRSIAAGIAEEVLLRVPTAALGHFAKRSDSCLQQAHLFLRRE